MIYRSRTRAVVLRWVVFCVLTLAMACSRSDKTSPRVLVYGFDWTPESDIPNPVGRLIERDSLLLVEGTGYVSSLEDRSDIDLILTELEKSIPVDQFLPPFRNDVRLECLVVTDSSTDTLSFSNSGGMYWRGRWRVLNWCILSKVIRVIPEREAASIRRIGSWLAKGATLQ